MLSHVSLGTNEAGPPGLRPKYDAHYYGAFVRDPDGNKIEAVSFAAG
jgi:catechol 2,3-dioxygenase-like lactoylglutathione lyase family enzyme